jgi:hypothetical protein
MREFQNGISNLLLLLAFSINRCKRIQTKENQLIISIIREYFLCHKTILNYSFFDIHQRSTLVFVKLLLLLFHDREKKNKQTNNDQFLEQYVYDHDFSEIYRSI